MSVIDTHSLSIGRPRIVRGRLLCAALLVLAPLAHAWAAPYLPGNDAQVLAELPTGARHSSLATREITGTRLDIALPLAQFYISRARATGDLRFLGYAEAILAPWMSRADVPPQVVVLHATILQSRHLFNASLTELDRALAKTPNDAQAWLTRATVLRVLGRYEEAEASCQRLSAAADPAITTLCVQSLRGLTGQLKGAYAAIAALPQQALPPEARAWRYSELGEMAERLGDEQAAEHWLREGLAVAPDDFYMRAACADVLLRQGRAAETLQLLAGYESMEPMLLRIAIAHKLLHDPSSAHSEALLSSAFTVEQQRGDAVHRREQARFLLDVAWQPTAALSAARENWQLQREPEDLLILLRAAQAAHQPKAGDPAWEFLKQKRLQDARLAPYEAVR
ncbi:MAG: tetratricopeptide repeat protein [Steroidobacteraceae bacterium]